MYQKSNIALAFLAASAAAQQIGTLTPEVHPKLPSQYCTRWKGCRTIKSSVVLDSQYRWLHTEDMSNCKGSSGLDPKHCPDAETCAKNCAVEGVDYASYGIATNGNSLTLNLFTENGTKASSPRAYLLGPSEDEYVDFKLLNKEFTYDVDVSKIPCGVNGALYFSEMSKDGSKNELNPAGAAYGTGYCDAQCPKNDFVDGKPNINATYGACCNEMDIWEANSIATAFTPHPCDAVETRACTGDECGSDPELGVCDKPGCDYQTYRLGREGFYGPGKRVDTTKPFTVVTQFYTHNGRDDGRLVRIARLYVQNGRVIQNAHADVDGIWPGFNFLSDNYCDAEAKAFNSGDSYVFEKRGGMVGTGKALGRGVVLALSIWMDAGSYMQWLDGTTGDVSSPGNLRGPCPVENSHPDYIQANFPDSSVTFSNIKWGDIGTTFKGRWF